MEKIRCKMCGSLETDVFYEDVKGYGIEKCFDLRKCSSCKTIFTYPFLSDEILSTYYDTQQVAFNGLGTDYLVIDYLKHREKYWKDLGYIGRVKEILKFYPEAKSILDVGCGAGFFLDCARENGLETFGLEISNWGFGVASRELKLNVLKSTLAKIGPKVLPPLDVITMYDVLEHSDNPVRDMNLSYNMLKKGGIVVINVPNVDSFISHLTKKYWNKLIPPNHTFHFSAETLTKLLTKTRFRVIAMSTNNGDSGELVGEVASTPWRLIGRVFSHVENAYSLRMEPISQHKNITLALVKGSRKTFSQFRFVGDIIKPLLIKYNKGEGLHIIVQK
ncbi:MAG: class I SAM-dependent methyltransferase [Patescibacteria group bacterium]|nr:class I SAM-dependent methyltransferase [Patescibacteria group bacterium]